MKNEKIRIIVKKVFVETMDGFKEFITENEYNDILKKMTEEVSLQYDKHDDLVYCLKHIDVILSKLILTIYAKNLNNKSVQKAIKNMDLDFFEKLKQYLLNDEKYEDIIKINHHR